MSPFPLYSHNALCITYMNGALSGWWVISIVAMVIAIHITVRSLVRGCLLHMSARSATCEGFDMSEQKNQHIHSSCGLLCGEVITVSDFFKIRLVS